MPDAFDLWDNDHFPLWLSFVVAGEMREMGDREMSGRKLFRSGTDVNNGWVAIRAERRFAVEKMTRSHLRVGQGLQNMEWSIPENFDLRTSRRRKLCSSRTATCSRNGTTANVAAGRYTPSLNGSVVSIRIARWVAGAGAESLEWTEEQVVGWAEGVIAEQGQ